MDNPQELPDDFIKLCQSVTAKRPKAVINHILQYGFVTTEELQQTYGYNHPPRAARDVRELGIPLETFRVTGSDGRKIAAYRFGDINKARFSRVAGRTGGYYMFRDVIYNVSKNPGSSLLVMLKTLINSSNSSLGKKDSF